MINLIIYILIAIFIFSILGSNKSADQQEKKKTAITTTEIRVAILIFIPILIFGIFTNFAYFFPGLEKAFLSLSDWGFRHSKMMGILASVVTILIMIVAFSIYLLIAYFMRRIKLWKLITFFLFLLGTYIYMMIILLNRV